MLTMMQRRARTYDPHETGRMRELEGLPLASFKLRAAAFVVDFLLCLAMSMVILIPGSLLGQRLDLLPKNVTLKFDFEHWYSLIGLVVYFGLSTYWGNGRTLGKRLMGIRIVSLVHERMTLWHSFERALGYGASFLEGGFGFLQYFIHPNRRTVHDRIAETIVVQDRKPRNERQPDPVV